MLGRKKKKKTPEPGRLLTLFARVLWAKPFAAEPEFYRPSYFAAETEFYGPSR